ncbi:hypothetical protein [Niveispirillum sp.]|uniref:hypothetical protein n=1 Tax=Niveispirillum sp. TaxID=1917217 RepID=UPI003BAC33C3
MDGLGVRFLTEVDHLERFSGNRKHALAFQFLKRRRRIRSLASRRMGGAAAVAAGAVSGLP